jgi:hypothetical protein
MSEDQELLEQYKHLLPDDDHTIIEGHEKDPEGDGRPRKEIDESAVIKLAKLGCTSDEIGHIVGLDGSNIRRRYGPLLKAVKSETKSALRRAQLNKAFNGDTAMLIWLGKNWLKQSDSGERLSDDNQVLPWQD